MKLKTFEFVTLYRFRYLIGYSLVIGLGLFLMLFRLGSLTPGLTLSEVTSSQASSVHAVIKQPINAPYHLLQTGTLKLLGQTALAIRLPSVFFGVLTIIGIYIFLKNTYTERVAVMGSILAGFSSTLLVFSRLGTSAIATAGSLAMFLGVTTWLMASEKIGWRQLLALSATSVAVLYSPLGLIWLMVLFIIHPLQLRKIIADSSKLWLFFAVLLLLLVISPLVWAFVQQPQMLKDWLLIPDALPKVRTVMWNLLRIPAAFFWRDTFADPTTHLGNLPLLDIFSTAMVTLGCLTLALKPTLARTRILLIFGLIGLLVNAVNPNPLNIAILLPVTSILAAVGLERMLEEWYRTFPKNPFARVGALIPLALIFSMTIFYHVHRSFIAWPKNPETKASHQNHLP